MLRLNKITEKENWNPIFVSTLTHFTQSFVYGEIQNGVGRKVHRYSIVSDGNEVIGFVQFVEYPLFGDMVYWYAPYGPILNNFDENVIKNLKTELTRVIKKTKVVFVRFDFCPTLDKNSDFLVSRYFTRSTKKSMVGAYYQPRDEWYTDINKDPESILSSMHQKTRYSVRYAEKKGVKTQIIKNGLTDYLPDFLALMKSTSERNNFSLHDDSYYKEYFNLVENSGNSFLSVAKYEDKILAVNLIVVYGNIAHYIFGASSNDYRELCAPYLLHFNSMLESKTLGVVWYNFGAVSVNSDYSQWKSLTVFKQKFGGTLVTHSNLFDMINNKFWYYAYIIRKLIRKIIK